MEFMLVTQPGCTSVWKSSPNLGNNQIPSTYVEVLEVDTEQEAGLLRATWRQEASHQRVHSTSQPAAYGWRSPSSLCIHAPRSRHGRRVSCEGDGIWNLMSPEGENSETIHLKAAVSRPSVFAEDMHLDKMNHMMAVQRWVESPMCTSSIRVILNPLVEKYHDGVCAPTTDTYTQNRDIEGFGKTANGDLTDRRSLSFYLEENSSLSVGHVSPQPMRGPQRVAIDCPAQTKCFPWFLDISFEHTLLSLLLMTWATSRKVSSAGETEAQNFQGRVCMADRSCRIHDVESEAGGWSWVSGGDRNRESGGDGM
ncbi:hypothetical protein JB92DRAFT_2837980 [Gautieria morchelliformis]|nr:hypothetical protein JB92DRAFT_2837980 [Gautieria morchelliformis]